MCCRMQGPSKFGITAQIPTLQEEEQLRIAVLVKEVPDTYGDRILNLETGLADRAASEAGIDEINERTLEVALSYADQHEGTEITVISMSPESATATVRKALAMGAAQAIHVVDEQLRGADMVLTAETLAAAIRQADFDLVISGNVSTDGSSGMIAAAIAEFLALPHLTGLFEIEITADRVEGSRNIDGGVQRVSADLPAVVSVTETMPEARFPNFKGIVAAKKKPLKTMSLHDLGVLPNSPDSARSIMLTVAERPVRASGVIITDEGDAGEKLAEFLLENRLV